jgi:hypothetical protein
MVADDLVLSSGSPDWIQSLKQRLMLPGNVLLLVHPKLSQCVFQVKMHSWTQRQPLNGARLGTSDSETHLGIIRWSDHLNKQTVNHRIQLVWRTSYSLMGAGLHGLNGVCPDVGKHLWMLYVQPRLLYGLETIILNNHAKHYPPTNTLP